MIKKLDKETFVNEVENGSGITLVDFYADWCGPCKMLGPIVEEVAKEYDGRVTFAKLNVDDEQELAIKYQVVSIPMLLLFKDGQKVDASLGLIGADEIKNMLDKNL
jgi:thioredoxin 1